LNVDMLEQPNPRVAYEAMYRAHLEAVCAYARRRVASDEWQDIVAETFYIAWRRFDKRPRNEVPWLLAIARRVAANQARSSRRRIRLIAAVGSAAERPLEHEANATDSGELVAAFNALPSSDQEALALVVWEQLRPAEAAQVLGINPLAFRVRLHRARARLRARYEEQRVAMRESQPRGVQKCVTDT
jgi:RNA polymerase sigma factor (sigma-70 family)